MSTAIAEHPTHQLTAEQLAQFREQGYVILPSFLDAGEIAALKAGVDHWVEVSRGGYDPYAKQQAERTRPLQIEMPAHGELISHPALMPKIEQILGPGFAYHHLHTARHDAGTPGVDWHHDYEQQPQTNRSHGMLHVFYYLNGLDGTIGDLLVLPKSQHLVGERRLNIFGQQMLPGTVVVDNLPPGSAVIVHSALWHARRAKPGGEGRPRYFIDCSYCQAGIQWPSAYPWWRAMLARAMELGLDRGGTRAHLFDPAHFFDVQEVMKEFSKHNVGSLAARLVSR